jgi:cytochrome c biogenesis protein CcmG/thiol:disulfide interchange protein DsbE
MISEDSELRLASRLLFITLPLVLMPLTGASNLLCAASIGQAAPALVVQELNGHTFDLAAERGKVTVVNFWATWCPPCRKEMPALDAVYKRYHAQGLEMIGLSADRPRDRSEVAKIMQSFSYPAAMLTDAKSDGFDEPTALPVTYVVDKNGIVQAKLLADDKPLTEQTLAPVVLPLLSGTSGTRGSTH